MNGEASGPEPERHDGHSSPQTAPQGAGQMWEQERRGVSGAEGLEGGGAPHCVRVQSKLWPRSRTTDRPTLQLGWGKVGTWGQTEDGSRGDTERRA